MDEDNVIYANIDDWMEYERKIFAKSVMIKSLQCGVTYYLDLELNWPGPVIFATSGNKDDSWTKTQYMGIPVKWQTLEDEKG